MVSHHVNFWQGTHRDVSIAPDHQLAFGDGIDGAWRRCQRHGFEHIGIAAHQGDAADLKAETADVLRCAKKAAVLSTIALRVLDHFPFGLAKDGDLKGLLDRYQAGIIPAAAHDCWGCCGRHGLRKRRRPSAVIVLSFVARRIIATYSSVRVARVGVQVTCDLGASGCGQ